MQIEYNPNKNTYIIGEREIDDATFIEIIKSKKLEQLLSKDSSSAIILSKNVHHSPIQDIPKKPIQKIFFGAPGTGKSYKINEYIKNNCSDYTNFVFRTTIYSDYSYYNFIGSIEPTMNDNNIEYNFKPGIFTIALKQALENINENIFLVIEEMTRGDIAAIFGDIFQLLDRDKNGQSEYPIDNKLIAQYIYTKEEEKKDKIKLPNNFHIIGSINTTDQNVYIMDSAFKRRFDFEYISVKPKLDEQGLYLNEYEFTLNQNKLEIKFSWNKLYQALNDFIVKKLGLKEDKQLGQFFLKFTNNKDDNYELIQNKLLHYLWDDIQGISYNDEIKIFNEQYVNFSDLYYAFQSKKMIFSDMFIKNYNMFGINDDSK